MNRIRFVKEIDGKMYLITNYRSVNGTIQFSSGKCWMFPLKKRVA